MNYVSLSAWLPACLSGLSESLPLTPMNQRLTPMHPGLTPGPTIAAPISTSAGGRGKARLHTGGRPAAMTSYPPATEGKCYKGIWGEGWEVGGKGQESSTTLAHGRAGHTQGILGGATEEPWCCCEVITVSLYSILLYSLSLYSYFIFYSTILFTDTCMQTQKMEGQGSNMAWQRI
jgi:hypothetical protein